METQIIDKLFLELSQVTHATTAKENALQKEVKSLREALVYVAFAGYDTPKHMLPKGVTLIDDDTVEVRWNDVMVRVTHKVPHQWQIHK